MVAQEPLGAYVENGEVVVFQYTPRDRAASLVFNVNVSVVFMFVFVFVFVLIVFVSFFFY